MDFSEAPVKIIPQQDGEWVSHYTVQTILYSLYCSTTWLLVIKTRYAMFVLLLLLNLGFLVLFTHLS